MGYIKSKEHFCDLNILAHKGSMLDCECGKKWYCRESSPGYKFGSWEQVDDARFARLSGKEMSIVEPQRNQAPPIPTMTKRANWFKRKFQLDKYPKVKL